MALPSRLTPEAIREYLAQGIWEPTTLADYWDWQASRISDAIAVSDGSRSLSWRQAKAWIDATALGLVRLGLARDDVLVIQLPNGNQLPLLRVACEKAGVLSLPVPRTFRQNEMRHCLQYTEAAAVVIPRTYRGFDYAGMVDGLRSELSSLLHVLISADSVPAGAISLADLARGNREDPSNRDVLEARRYDACQVSLISPTTGSTGVPKFAEYTAAARLVYGRAYVETLGLDERDVLAALSPASGGPNIPVYFAAPQVGARAVFLEHFEPEAAFGLIQREAVSVACVVPTQLAMMVGHASRRRYDLSSVRYWVSVGAPLAPSLAEAAERELGGIVLNTYGAADWGGVVFTSPADSPEVRYFTVGSPRAGTDVRVVDEAGRRAGPGEVGELQGRGPSCSTGYYKDPDGTRRAWTSDGWFPLADLGRQDDRGNLMVVGRKSDLIIRGGQNIEPLEIESHLLAHPRVKQVAVVGVADSTMGERVCACVVLEGGTAPSPDELGDFLRQRGLAPFKFPELIEVMDHLPMVSDTKVDKRALRAAIAARGPAARGLR